MSKLLLVRTLLLWAVMGGIVLTLEWLVRGNVPAESIRLVVFVVISGVICTWVHDRLKRTESGRRFFADVFGQLLYTLAVTGVMIALWELVIR